MTHYNFTAVTLRKLMNCPDAELLVALDGQLSERCAEGKCIVIIIIIIYIIIIVTITLIIATTTIRERCSLLLLHD
jgi:hypothetical protein